MAANTDDGAMFLVKKFGGFVLIILGVIGIAVGLEYRTTDLSIGLAALGGLALVCGMGLLVLKIVRRNVG
jgi:1,4-dihydroxy-2-naphthoate octaprenyltransferase